MVPEKINLKKAEQLEPALVANRVNAIIDHLTETQEEGGRSGGGGVAAYMALTRASRMVAELSGSCPGDHELINMDHYGCGGKCCKGRAPYCWLDYFDKTTA